MADCSNMSDAELVHLLKAGDHKSFSEIYERYSPLLFIYAYKKLQDEEGAKDIIQEVYIYLWNSRENLTIQTTLAGYLYKAVLNRVLNIFRHIKITREYIASFQNIINHAPEQTDYLIREKDFQKLIEKEIRQLPEKMRVIFLMRYRQHLSYKEIAQQLHLSEHTVSTQIKRSLKTLKGRLGFCAFLYLLLLGIVNNIF